MQNAIEQSALFARKIKLHALRMVHAVNASHIGSCFSMADLLAVLYTSILRIDPAAPAASNRDRFILSKGHATAILYAALAERGFFPLDWLDRYSTDGSPLTGHVNHSGVPGVEASTGSLGHGLGLGCGMALALRADASDARVFVMISDGECDEGSTWEAALFAPFHKLDNLVVMVDYNKIQSFGTVKEVLDLEPLADKWRAFGWHVVELDGHDFVALHRAFSHLPPVVGKPTLILAHTVKGKGVSFMEQQLAWHYRSPNPSELERAIAEVSAS
jgi:transketolase